MSTLIEDLKQKLDHLQFTLSRGYESHYKIEDEDLSNILRTISEDLIKLDANVIKLKRNVLLLKEENNTMRYVWSLCSVVIICICYYYK